ncbi:MAG: PKD domain-containing protein [Rhodothermales bacterium]
MSLSRWLPCLSLLAVFMMTGCSPKHVEVLGVSGPDSLETNQAGTFTATTNEDAKPPIMYQWDFADNTSGEGNPVSHAFARPGTYTVTVNASNRKGKSTDSDQTSVVVFDPPVPAQVITVLADPQNPDTRTPVRFGANVRGDLPLNYAWSFGDGSTDNGAAPIHTFDQPGTYTVSLEVSNDAGSDSRSVSITVQPFEADYCAELAEMNAVFFDRNSSVMTAQGEGALRDNLDILQDCPNLNVRVEGWAGPFERNPQRLSDDRARAVQQYYVDNGVVASRIATMGQGRAGLGAKKSGGEQFRRADSIPLQNGM